MKRTLAEAEFDDRDGTGRPAKQRIEASEQVVQHPKLDGESTGLPTLQYPAKDMPARPVAIQYPSRLLTFSYNNHRKLLFDDSTMKYYVPPPPNADLRYGYPRWVKRPEERGRLDGLLKALLRYAEGLDGDQSAPNQDVQGTRSGDWLQQIGVVSWRGVMTKILIAPYEERDSWELNIMRINDTLYLEEHISDEKLIEKENMTPHHRQQSYYGYSFESFCTSSRPNKPESLPGHPPGWSGDVNTNAQWCSVVKTKLASHRLLIGGEVDCVNARHQSVPTNKAWSPESYIELKTSMAIRGPQDEVKFERKLLKFYFQSFLLGVPEIIVGFRTPPGRLVQTQSFKTTELPRLVRGKPHAWDPHVCMHWGDTFLQFLKEQIPSQRSEDKKRNVWRVKFAPGAAITLIPLGEDGVADVEAGEKRVGFIPDWYFDGLRDIFTPPSS